jgi:hypothetical protein
MKVLVLCQEPGLYIIHGPPKSGKSTFLKSILYGLKQSNLLTGPIYRCSAPKEDDRDHYLRCFGALDSRQFSQASSNGIITLIDDQPPTHGADTRFQNLIPLAARLNYRMFLVVQSVDVNWALWANCWFHMPSIDPPSLYQPFSDESKTLIKQIIANSIPNLISPLIDLIFTYVLFSSACLECVKHL